MTETEIQFWANELDRHTLEARELDRITLKHADLTLADAYRIQSAGIALRKARGERVCGYKMGLTSKAKMKQMGVSAPISGVLTEPMRVDSELSLKGRIHAKIEPEIAFVLKKGIRTRLSFDEALASIDGVCAAMEIIDSRYRNFNFTLPDVIADNCSSSAFVLGPLRKADLELGNLGIFMEIDGKPTLFGASSAILGHPVQSLVDFSAMAEQQGLVIESGAVVLAGAATEAVMLKAGMKIETFVQDLGAVSLIIRE